MSGTITPPVAPVIPARVAPPEPKLTKLIRFDAGTVEELMDYIKAWVDWRTGKTPATADSGAVKVGGGAINY